ncbi:MAG: hypothetical protein ACJAVY_001997, partial [Marinoscillum sp.]
MFCIKTLYHKKDPISDLYVGKILANAPSAC